MKEKWKKRVQGNSTCRSICSTFLCFVWRARWPRPWPHLGATDGGCEDRSAHCAHCVLGLLGRKNYNIGDHGRRARIEVFAMSEASAHLLLNFCDWLSPAIATNGQCGTGRCPGPASATNSTYDTCRCLGTDLGSQCIFQGLGRDILNSQFGQITRTVINYVLR